MNKISLITGITGQDGSFLAELLLEKGHKVYGIQRRTSTITTSRIDHLLEKGLIDTQYGDLDDANSIIRLLLKIKPDYIFNMGSQSHVRVSFDIPVYTSLVTGVAPLKILEALRTLDMKETRYYQASSSEMFGISPPPQNEDTPMFPQSPYGCAKLMAYHLVRAYRTGYKMFACNGILFNHSGERRGINFVEQKICHEAAKIKLGIIDRITLGNIEAKRDWGHSKDFMKGVIKIIEHDVPLDFVIATSEQYSVREFAEKVFHKLGMDFYQYVRFDDIYLRPNEVPSLCGDATKAHMILGWKPEINFEKLVDIMVAKAMEDEEFALYKSKRNSNCNNR